MASLSRQVLDLAVLGCVGSCSASPRVVAAAAIGECAKDIKWDVQRIRCSDVHILQLHWLKSMMLGSGGHGDDPWLTRHKDSFRHVRPTVQSAQMAGLTAMMLFLIYVWQQFPSIFGQAMRWRSLFGDDG